MKVKKMTSNYDYDDSAYTYFGIDFSNVIDMGQERYERAILLNF